MTKNRLIGFRLRKEIDEDIAQAIKDLDNGTVSEMARSGLRMVLGITTQKVQETCTREMPVSVPAVWRPKARG